MSNNARNSETLNLLFLINPKAQAILYAADSYHLTQKFNVVMEPENSLPSEKKFAGACPDSEQSSTYPHIFPDDSFSVIHLRLSLSLSQFLSFLRTSNQYFNAFIVLHAFCLPYPVQPIRFNHLNLN
jgi:hypothetical protein